MPLKAKSKQKKNFQRHDEVPFYQLRHSFDELPLDPVKPFIIEKIQKLKSSRSSAFAADLNLLSYDINACCASATDPDVSRKIRSDLRQTPSVKVASIKTESDHGKDYDWQWLQDEDGCKTLFVDRTMGATEQLKIMCNEQRSKNFKRNAQILTALKYGKRKTKSSAIKNSKNTYMRYYIPYKPGDEFKHRTPEERQRELKRIGNMIDDIIASKWSRINENTMQNSVQRKSSAVEQVKPRKKHKSLTNEEFLISLKMKEKR